MADLQRVEIFLQNHPHLELIKDHNNREKVRCKLTNHELPCCVSAVELYTKGKKYQRLTKKTVQSQGFENYKEFLVPHTKKRNLLFCQLTKKTINNIPHHIEQHVSGRRFTKALAQFKTAESKEGNEDAEMWAPSDLESDSADSELEAEEIGEDAEDSATKMNDSEEEQQENGHAEEFSSDENEEPFVEEPVENDSSKVRRSNPARRKNKQDRKREIEGNSDEITPSKKARTEKKKKQSSKNSQNKQSGTVSATKEKKRKTPPQPKKMAKKSGKRKVQ